MTRNLALKLPIPAASFENDGRIVGEVDMPADIALTIGEHVTIQDRDGTELGRCMVVSLARTPADINVVRVTLGALLR